LRAGDRETASVEITFSAFLLLREKLDEAGVACRQERMDVPEGCTADGLVRQIGLGGGDVEAVFVNGRVVPGETVLDDGDRVALVPPGTPGPHRYLMGIAHRA